MQVLGGGAHAGRLYVVMRYVDGSDLARLLSNGPLPHPRAAALIAVIVVGAVILSDSLSGNPQLRRVTEQNVQQAIDQVKQFVNDNTK